jgi:hypothetical protein
MWFSTSKLLLWLYEQFLGAKNFSGNALVVGVADTYHLTLEEKFQKL